MLRKLDLFRKDIGRILNIYREHTPYKKIKNELSKYTKIERAIR